MLITKEPTAMAPCQAACPAKIDVPRYIRAIQSGEFDLALAIIREKVPFPAILGYVCMHPCEAKCNMNLLDGAVAIRALKRLAAEKGTAPQVNAPTKTTNKKVAIVGSGPAGLSCAYYLAGLGCQVTVYEKLPLIGGMLSVGIPEDRLPRSVIDADLQVIRDRGVDIKTNITIGKDRTIDQLLEEGYKAIFLSVGAHISRRLGIEGENLQGVYPGVGFLRDTNSGKHITLGERVAVIGGGNVAIDAVRTAHRKGSTGAFVLYRRDFTEMPAAEEEVEKCKEEGIEIHTLASPKRIIGDNGRVTAIEIRKVRLGDPDETGRPRPVPIEGSEFIIEVDSVIPAIGQESDWECLAPESGCEISESTAMIVDPETHQTNRPYIFAGGDAVTGPRTVIEAIEDGKQAAVSIDKYLGGSGDVTERFAPLEGEVTFFLPDLTTARARIPIVAQGENGTRFLVEQTLKEEEAILEAGRCLRCDLPIMAETDNCYGCFTCELICSLGNKGAFSLDESEIYVDRVWGGSEYKISFSEDCISCGLCVRYCPHDVFKREKGKEA